MATAPSSDLEDLIQLPDFYRKDLIRYAQGTLTLSDISKLIVLKAKQIQRIVRKVLSYRPPEQLSEIYELTDHSSPLAQLSLLSCPRCPPSVVRSCAASSDQDVLCAVAEHPLCPPDILDRLTGHQKTAIAWAAVRNPRCSTSTLIRLMEDPKYWGRRAMLYNPNTPPEIISRFAFNANPLDRALALQHPNCPPNIHAIYALAE